ncbi:MAG: hypothetical protein JWR67_1405 [Mucilaginibacter sp.]|nr:hypothetical protein [Mucilaginibacter sp.]
MVLKRANSHLKSEVALIFIFNHRYDKNIALLEDIYKGRFSNIYHLVPFYDGPKENVIAVYENSYFFQGYLAQGFKYFFKEKFEHYFFVGDDLLLNPSINENNYKEYFKLSSEASFIPEIFEINNLKNNDTLRFLNVNNLLGRQKKWHWTRIREVINYKHWVNGIENDKAMPSYKEAEEIFQQRGFIVKPLSYKDVYGGLFPISLATSEKRKQLARFLLNLLTYKKRPLAYPLVGSYADILIISNASIKKFCHYCGVLAGNKLFVEFAIPTALVLSSNAIVTEPQLNKRGEIYWTYTPKEALNYQQKMEAYHYNLDELLKNFPRDKIYIHPIKLSKWKT